jgi:hypothetical protein
MYRLGSSGHPVCALRCVNLRRPLSAYEPESTTAPWQDGQRFGDIT